MTPNSQLQHRVFTADEGVFVHDLNRRLRYLRMVAEDVESSLRTSDQLRMQQNKDAHVDPERAGLRYIERNFMAEKAERSAIREAALLLTTLAKHADPEVFTEEVGKVITPDELDSVLFALGVVRNEQEVV